MKTLIALALAVVLLLSSSAMAIPMLFDVWSSSDGLLGQISAYSGTETHVGNYAYTSASGHPINGPTPAAYESNVWFYYNTNSSTMSFNFIHNVDNGGGAYWNHVQWDLNFNGMNYSTLLQDDNPNENQGEGGIVDNGGGSVDADFAYTLNTDGGVMGIDPLSCCDWAITINPTLVGDIQSINFHSGAGGALTGWTNPTPPPTGLGGGDNYYYDYDGPAFRITPHCEIPEPGTLLLLGSGLLIGGGVLRRRKK